MFTASVPEARLTAALRYGAVLAVFLVAVLFFLACRRPTVDDTAAASPVHTQDAVPAFAWQGVASCAAMPCHHGNSPSGAPGNEFAVWFQQDPHARAYEVLTEESSRNISRHLRRQTEPDHDALCVGCHVHPNWEEATKNPAFSLSDGVGCESCHGPAQAWLKDHYRKKDLSDADRRRGMRDTRSLSGRIRICLDCHVGTAGQDVNHDLIAAGHPALRFEFGAYHAALPHHWDDRKDRDRSHDPRGRPDFEARAWAAGQVASSQAALRLLAVRAASPGTQPWPEFAEYDCLSCHHDLQTPSWRQSRTRAAAGTPLWGDWYFSGLKAALMARKNPPGPNVEDIVSQVEQIKKQLESWNPPRQAVDDRASRLIRQLEREWIGDRDDLALPKAVARQLIRESENSAMRSWDSATQIYLGLTALGRAWQDAHPGRHSPLDPVLVRMKERLNSPGAIREDPATFVPRTLPQALDHQTP